MADLRVGELLLSQDDLTKKVNTKRGIFTLKMPDPMVRKAIIRSISNAIDRAPLESIPAMDYLYVKATETLKYVVTEYPEWWEGADKCMDDDLILELYDEFLKFENDFRRRVRGNRPDGRGKSSKPA